MIEVYRIDNNGFYIEPVRMKKQDEIPTDCVEAVPTEGLYRAKWDGEKWVEGLTQEELEEIMNRPIEPSDNEVLRDYLLDVDFRLIILELGGI